MDIIRKSRTPTSSFEQLVLSCDIHKFLEAPDRSAGRCRIVGEVLRMLHASTRQCNARSIGLGFNNHRRRFGETRIPTGTLPFPLPMPPPFQFSQTGQDGHAKLDNSDIRQTKLHLYSEPMGHISIILRKGSHNDWDCFSYITGASELAKKTRFPFFTSTMFTMSDPFLIIPRDRCGLRVHERDHGAQKTDRYSGQHSTGEAGAKYRTF
jgi:hypothetical protein